MSSLGSNIAIPGNQDVFGGTLYNAIDHLGPTSYLNGTGEKLNPSAFGFFNGFKDVVDGCIDTTGTYYVRKQLGSPGGLNAAIYLRWYVLSSNAEVGNATNLSAIRLRLSAFGY